MNKPEDADIIIFIACAAFEWMVKKGLKKGYRLFILTADDTGIYGLDIDSSLPKLLHEIIKIHGDFKIYIRNLHPQWLVRYIDELEEIIKSGKIEFVESPLDSCNSRILKLVNRYSNIEKIKDALIRLKKSYPNIKLFTHAIMGFPTETEEEFKNNLSFIKEMDFFAGIIISFDCRKGTEIEKIEPKLSEKIISKRIKYSKKFFKKAGYNTIYTYRKHYFSFSKKY